MAVLLKKRLINPSKRRMSARQKLFFGTKQQRAAAKRSLSGKRVSNSSRNRVKNVGEIITLSLPKKKVVTEVIKNPMAVRRHRKTVRRKNAPKTWSSLYQRAYKQKATGTRKRRRNGAKSKVANPSRTRRRSATKIVTKYRYRNPMRKYVARRRRRNPEWISADFTKVAGILGGAAVTNLIAKQLPSKYTSGTMGYATLAAIAFGQGYAIEKVMKNRALGQDMMIGGLVLVTMKLLSDLFPSISLPFSLNGPGLGLIGNSSFTVPQVAVPGSMGRFQIAPNYQTAINNAIPQVPVNAVGTRAMTGLHGINQSVTMGGRTGSRRVGRLN